MKNTIKNIFIALIAVPLLTVSFSSCEDDDDDIETRIIEKTVEPTKYNLSINMVNKVNGNDLIMNTTNKPYTNEAGQAFNVTRLRYLISDIAFHKADGSCFTIDEYHFVDESDASTFVFNPTTKVPEGVYTSISFNFGFDLEDNQTGIYADLNSPGVNFQWPVAFGGGYHFMQLEGNYDSSGTDRSFLTHMGTAMNITPRDTTFEDNHFEAKPMNSAITISGDSSFDIEMNVEEWYKTPYTWDFNVYPRMIMPRYDPQRKLNLNGPSVFTVTIP